MKIGQFLKKNSFKEGDIVEAKKDGTAFTGTIVPSKDQSMLALKLNSGYNINIKLDGKTSAKKISEGKGVGKPKPAKLEKKPGLPTVSILQIGGTIAARVDYRTGAVFVNYEPEDLIALVPELGQMANIESRLVSNMFSEDMRFAHYKVIAKEIEKEAKKDIKGIVLPHGTDTMTYTAAALEFMLKDIQIPVILVGAQRSTDRGSTDAIMNLICAFEFITKTDFVGVGICMHETSEDKCGAILPPCKTRKMHTSRRDAFKPVNDTAIARINFETKKIDFLKDYRKKDPAKKLELLGNIEEKTALVKVYPNFFAKQIEFFRKNKFKGVVIEGTGLGQAPVGTPNSLCGENKKIMKEMALLAKSGCIIAMTSQCIFGAVQMHIYANAVDLVNIGVLPGKDMLPETAFVKLAWLLGNYKNKEEIKRLFQTNLRGEINERTPLDSTTPDYN